jgi:CRISPR/Cas system-associated exonuclease Cas4 (RecB family)
MGIGKSLGKAFRLPQAKQAATNAKVVPPPEPAGVAPHYDFAKIYELHLWKECNSVEARKRSGRKQGVFSPSSGLHPSIGLCERQLMFKLLCAPESETRVLTKIVKVMANGTSRHAGFQADCDAMAEQGWMGIVRHEKEVTCQHHTLPIYGHADGVWTMASGWRFMYDLKTWSSSNCSRTFEPEWKHRLQLNTYEGLYAVRAGYMVYENKDTQDWLTPLERFRVNFDPKMYSETEMYCAGILKQLKKRKLPVFSERVCKANVMFCAYTEVCLAETSNDGLDWSEYDQRTPEILAWHEGAV